ncbi:Non-functional pseudokinase ZRK15 [Cardamine amara subsp. amara]|uniref:Non-functional pseudokinase ZRK15 n=1 Tax=Cardamine amara subsp. amara TaxID=228776 RepID=A0ABD0ZIQ5_CARAN
MLLIKKWRYRVNEHNRDNFCRDIAISSMVSGHKNFMKLVGCCLESERPVLVYRVVEKPSSLDLKMVVSWRKRIKIAEDIATALAYLHTAFPRPFVYRILRLGDILLDEDGVAKLCNCSHCVSIPQGETFVKLGCHCVGGDYDYMDDNYLINGVVSEKTDTFGFGIFMQKLLTGEERFRELYGWSEWKTLENRKFPNWLSKCMGEGRVDEIVDPKILEHLQW